MRTKRRVIPLNLIKKTTLSPALLKDYYGVISLINKSVCVLKMCVQHVVRFLIPVILLVPDSSDEEKILTSSHLHASATSSCLKSEVNSGNWHYLCQL